MNFSWAVYGFNSGHFLLAISKRNLPFSVVLACDPFEYSHTLFHKFSACPTVLPSVGALLDHILASGEQVLLDGYLIHSHCYQTNEPAMAFWGIHASIVIQLWLIWKFESIYCVHPPGSWWPQCFQICQAINIIQLGAIPNDMPFSGLWWFSHWKGINNCERTWQQSSLDWACLVLYPAIAKTSSLGRVHLAAF